MQRINYKQNYGHIMLLTRQGWFNHCSVYCVNFASDVHAKTQNLSSFCDTTSAYSNILMPFCCKLLFERLEEMEFKQFAILRHLSRRMCYQLISNECSVSVVNRT